MSKLVSLKANGELNISVENKLFKSIRSAHAWYTSKKFATPALIILMIIDIAGFWQIAQSTISDNEWVRVLIIAAFTVAFEMAPLYIGYVMCLKSYGLGKTIHSRIFGLSFISFSLGILVNVFYRIFTMNIAYKQLSTDGVTFETSELALPMTILMCVLPVITSLMNIVIGCLSFDPLLYDILKLTQKLRILQIRKQQLENYIDEMEQDEYLKNISLDDEQEAYSNAKNEIVAVNVRLKKYISIHSYDSNNGGKIENTRNEEAHII